MCKVVVKLGFVPELVAKLVLLISELYYEQSSGSVRIDDH